MALICVATQLRIRDIVRSCAGSLKPIIFPVNNNGYTIERRILGPGSSYNDIQSMAICRCRFLFDPQDQAIACRVWTESELEDALAAARDREAFVLIERVISRLNAPDL